VIKKIPHRPRFIAWDLIIFPVLSRRHFELSYNPSWPIKWHTGLVNSQCL